MKEIRWKVYAGEVLFVEEASHRWDEFIESSKLNQQHEKVQKVVVDLSLQGLPDSVVTFLCRTVLPWIADQSPESVELNFQRCGLSPQGVRQLVQGILKTLSHMTQPKGLPKGLPRSVHVQLCLAENEVENETLGWIHQCLSTVQEDGSNGNALRLSLDLSGNPISLDGALPLLTLGFGPQSSYRAALEPAGQHHGCCSGAVIHGLSLLDTDVVVETPAQLQLFADLLLTHSSLAELAINWSGLAEEDLELLYSAASSNINKNNIMLDLVNVDPNYEEDASAAPGGTEPSVVCLPPEQILPTPKMQALFCLNKQLREELAESRRQNEVLMRKLKKRREKSQLLKAKAKEAAATTESAPSSKPASRTSSLTNLTHPGKSTPATSIGAQSDLTAISVFGVPTNELPARTQRLLATRPVNALPLKTLKPAAAAPLSRSTLGFGTSRAINSGQSWH